MSNVNKDDSQIKVCTYNSAWISLMMTLCKQCLFPGLSEVPLNSLACNWIVLLKQITYLLTIVIQRRLYRRHSFKCLLNICYGLFFRLISMRIICYFPNIIRTSPLLVDYQSTMVTTAKYSILWDKFDYVFSNFL